LDDEEILTIDGFLRLARSKRVVALKMVEDRDCCAEAWKASGFAVELLLKAVIMKRQGFNQWPSREHRPDLHQHNLRQLCRLAEIDLATLPGPLRLAFRMALDWNREHDYVSKRMRRKVARSMVDAVFGEQGVAQWLERLL